MKVAFLTTDLSEDNGWACYSREIIERLPQYGIEPIILMVSSSYYNNSQGLKSYNILESFPDKQGKLINLIGDCWQSRGLVNDCQIVHSMVEPFHALGFCLTLFGRKPLIVSVHGTFSTSILASPWRALYRRAYTSAKAILSVSRYTANQVAVKLPQVTDKIYPIPLGVSFQNSDSIICQASSREHALLAVGQVKPRKGTLQAVIAMARVAQQFPDAKLYIAGLLSNKDYVDTVKSVVDENGLEKNIVWLGEISTDVLKDYYSRVRGLVMPSMNIGKSFEGFGLVHLEANSYGVPAIGSLNCGNEDAIADGYSGFLIEQGNIEKLSEAMIKLLDSNHDWNQMSENSLQFARQMTWDKTVEKYVSTYQNLMDFPTAKVNKKPIS